MDREGCEDRLDRIVGADTRTSGRIELLVGGDHFFPRLINAIIDSRKAKGYIYIQNAYFSDTAIIHELAKARLRGKEMNLGSSKPGFVADLLDTVFTPDFEAAVELDHPLPAGWGNTFASIIASQL